MPVIKLTTMDRVFVPDVTFPTEEGGRVKNRELAPEERVEGDIRLANTEEKAQYLGSYSVYDRKKKSSEVKSFTAFQIGECLKKKLGSVRGLEAFKITSGTTLVSHEPTPELNDTIMQFFLKINGVHEDDNLDDDAAFGSEGGDLTEGES